MASSPDTKQPRGCCHPGGYWSLCHHGCHHRRTSHTGASELKEARGEQPALSKPPTRLPRGLVYSEGTLSDAPAAVCADEGDGDLGCGPGSSALKKPLLWVCLPVLCKMGTFKTPARAAGKSNLVRVTNEDPSESQQDG